MLLEVSSTIVMGGIAGYAYFQTNGNSKNDSEKILRILNNSGLNVKENGVTKTVRIMRRSDIEGGKEYVYQLPLGLSSKRVMESKALLEDGLNTRHSILQFEKKELLTLTFDRTIVQQIRQIFTEKKVSRKEIEMEFDGMLKIRVFDERLSDNFTWSDEILKAGTWAVPVGRNRKGVIYHDFDKRKHLIVAGATGFGKSVAMKSMITALIMNKPDDVTFSLIDLKGGPAFARFKEAKQVENFGTDTKEAKEILLSVQSRMESGYREIVDGGFEDVSEANISGRHFLVIDEGADLAADKSSMEILTDIVRKGRGAGVYVIYSTQYPTKESIPMQVKRNIPARLCYVLDSSVASVAVLDAGGAEDLPEIPGRGIYKELRQIIVQSPYMSNKQIDERIKPHINFKPRKDEKYEQTHPKATENGKYPLQLTKV